MSEFFLSWLVIDRRRAEHSSLHVEVAFLSNRLHFKTFTMLRRRAAIVPSIAPDTYACQYRFYLAGQAFSTILFPQSNFSPF